MDYEIFEPGTLVRIKPEFLAPYERDIPYMVIEDRGDRLLVRELREYSNNTFLGSWVWPKETMYIMDDQLMKPEEEQVTYIYRAHDDSDIHTGIEDDHVLKEKDFDNFKDAFDYAQKGLYVYIYEVPIKNGQEQDEDIEVVWSYDSTRDEKEARKALHNKVERDLLEDYTNAIDDYRFNPDDFANDWRDAMEDIYAEEEAARDDIEMDKDIEKAVLGDNIKFYNAF